MKKSGITIIWFLFLTSALFIILSGCQAQPTPTTMPVVYSEPQLKYRLIGNFGEVFYCDPDFYPVARPGEEEKNVLEQYPAIRANSAEFSVIRDYLGLPDKADYTNEEKLLIYRQHKKLTLAVQMTASGDIYNFTLRVGEVEGLRIEGTVTPTGKITVLKQETSFNTCPICLAKGTLIDTPAGQIPVEQLSRGMAVWTVDDSGRRVSAPVIEVTATPVSSSFKVVRVRLDDGRSVTASPGHPAANGRALGDYRAGDVLDGAAVVLVEYLDYEDSETYDVLPSGTTGLYWANGILLKSTLATN